MNTVWTIIGSVGTSLLASGGLVWLFREWISARLTKSIQHEYDIKLEDFKNRIHYEYELKLESSKTDFQTILNERQTRFQYWYDEKAKAIKELYIDACELYNSLYFLQLFERLFGRLSIKEKKANGLDIRINTINSQRVEMKKNWYKLRLFLSDEEDTVFNDLKKEMKEWYSVLTMSDEQIITKEIQEKREEHMKCVENAIEKLRTIFQETLCNATIVSPRSES